MCFNALDRHLPAKANDVCMVFEGNDNESRSLSWGAVHSQVCKFANVLKRYGVGRGDRVAIYMPMVPELPIAMLACARIGAMHSVVFGGFSSEALAQRIVHCGARILITADGVMRGTKLIELKSVADDAMEICTEKGSPIKTCIVYERKPAQFGAEVAHPVLHDGRDVSWARELESASASCDVEWMDAEDPLFLLYTSGSTGTPKGVVHTTGGYMCAIAPQRMRAACHQHADLIIASQQ
eukprot:SAG31_NODE_10_length_40133_cov_27.863041_11_plen_239_part_00